MNERFRCTEAIFKPKLIGKEEHGMDANLYKSIIECDSDLRNDLFENILLTGGNTKRR